MTENLEDKTKKIKLVKERIKEKWRNMNGIFNPRSLFYAGGTIDYFTCRECDSDKVQERVRYVTQTYECNPHGKIFYNVTDYQSLLGHRCLICNASDSSSQGESSQKTIIKIHRRPTLYGPA